MSISIINLYEVYNSHSQTIRELLRSRFPDHSIHILNVLPPSLKKGTLNIFVTSDEFLYFFQNLRDEYCLDGCVFINVRNLYPGMIAYKYKSYRHIYNAMCQGRRLEDIRYSIVKSEHHWAFFEGVKDYLLIDFERDFLPAFSVAPPTRPTFQLTEYDGFYVIGDEKRAQRSIGSVLASFIPIDYIIYHDDYRFVDKISAEIMKKPNKRIAVLYYESTGIPEFYAIYKLLASPVYRNGNIDLLTIRDEYRSEYRDMYNKWENGGKEMSADELEPIARLAFEHIQYLNPPSISYQDVLDVLLEDSTRTEIVSRYGHIRKYDYSTWRRDIEAYFGPGEGLNGLFGRIRALKPVRQREQTHMSSYSVRPFYEVPYSLQGEGVALHLPPLEEAKMERVSVVTPTRYRGMLLMNVVWSLNNSVYPHKLIEWVILDNGDKEAEKTMDEKHQMNVWLPLIRATLNPDIKLKYVQEDANKYTLGELRNRAVAQATAPIIVFMDDDDFYPPESILARVKALNIRPDLRCVGCVRIINLNVETNQWNMTGMEKYLSEASLAFRRRFWEERPFARQKCNEIALFIYGREDMCCHILSQFVIFSVYHKANFTGDLRQIKTETKQSLSIDLPDEVRDRFTMWMRK